MRPSKATRGKWRIPDDKVGERSIFMFGAERSIFMFGAPKVIAPTYVD
jgi:hypothetical protein